MHIHEWKSLKLSDFPQFKCLCELCDCGCFERSNKKHSTDCNRRIYQLINGIEAYNSKQLPFNDTTLYTDSFKDIEEVSSLRTPFKKKSLKKANLIFPSNNENLSTTKTTNKEHFQGWIGQPAISSHESDEIASQLIYPNKKRLMLTTNKELFHSNYGNFKPQPTGIDLFEKTFKINENDNTLDLKTIYRNDFTKLKGNYVCDRVTRNLFEKTHQKSFKHKIPMEFKTQNMIDFIDYDNKYKEFQKIKAYNKLFQEDVYSMRKNLSDTYYRKPLSDIVEENDHIVTEYRSKSQFNLGSNYYYNRNNNNNNIQEIPNLKVIKKLPSMVFFNNKKVIPPIPSIPSIPATQRWESSSLNDLNNNNNNKNTTGSSSYREDFKNPGGFELCRMKAYKVLTNQNKIKKIKNPSNEKINVEN